MLRIVAPNPGPMTLEGTNTYVYGADPCVVIDPGKGYAIVYCEDPWGTVIEVCSHPYAQLWA